MIDVRIDGYDAAAAAGQSSVVHRAYSEQYPPGPPVGEWCDGMWSRHRARDGFDLLIARDGDDLVGLVWGYVGGRGQYWTDLAVASLPHAVAEAWLGGHFEVVELIVNPAYRRRGVGRALLGEILARSSKARAVLSVDDDNVAAQSLYESMGWEVLGPFSSGKSVMGVVLR